MKYFVIFALMSMIGWFIEVIYRSWKAKKIVNPGLMLGCTLPVYGIGGIILNLLASLKLVNSIYLNYFLLSLIASVFALKKIFYLLYPYKNIYEFILSK